MARERSHWCAPPAFLALAIVALLAWQVFFRLAPLLPFHGDTFYATYMLHRGTLPEVNLDVSPPEVMPYQERRWLSYAAWRLAWLLGDGGITDYFNFLFVCHTLTAGLVFWIARLLGLSGSV